jgi:cell division protein FtsW
MSPAVKRKSADSWLFIVAIALVALGILIVFDSSFARAGDKAMGNAGYFVERQLFYATLGLVGLFAAMRIHPRVFKRITWAVLTIAGVLLLAVMVPGVGKSIGGAARWIPIGPFHLQPSEFAKLGVIMYLSDQLATGGKRIRVFNNL